jgi:NAD(P)-dependent dehydrogenase (short-subunit alcohol dehydrogenase family)
MLVDQFVVNLSSTVAYMWSTMAPERPSYGLTKSASTLLLQQIAKDTPVDQMQIVSFHPGGVLTDMARRAGFNEHMGIPFDDGMLTPNTLYQLVLTDIARAPTRSFRGMGRKP